MFRLADDYHQDAYVVGCGSLSRPLQHRSLHPNFVGAHVSWKIPFLRLVSPHQGHENAQQLHDMTRHAVTRSFLVPECHVE